MNNFNNVRFACTALMGTNKVGNIVKGEDGYYEMVVGALNVFNSNNQFYVYDEAVKLFEDSSQFKRRVAKGVLKGENGHPKMEIGQRPEDFARRVMSIYEERICCHHKEIYLDYDRIKDEKGRPIIAIMSRVAASGELGYVFENAMKNKDENVCFSIRSFTRDFYDPATSIIKKTLKAIVTFDLVNEPGIAHATKYNSPALESFGEDIIIQRSALERAIMNPKASVGMGMESTILTGQELFKSMGWFNDDSQPGWSKW